MRGAPCEEKWHSRSISARSTRSSSTARAASGYRAGSGGAAGDPGPSSRRRQRRHLARPLRGVGPPQEQARSGAARFPDGGAIAPDARGPRPARSAGRSHRHRGVLVEPDARVVAEVSSTRSPRRGCLCGRATPEPRGNGQRAPVVALPRDRWPSPWPAGTSAIPCAFKLVRCASSRCRGHCRPTTSSWSVKAESRKAADRGEGSVGHGSTAAGRGVPPHGRAAQTLELVDSAARWPSAGPRTGTPKSPSSAPASTKSATWPSGAPGDCPTPFAPFLAAYIPSSLVARSSQRRAGVAAPCGSTQRGRRRSRGKRAIPHCPLPRSGPSVTRRAPASRLGQEAADHVAGAGARAGLGHRSTRLSRRATRRRAAAQRVEGDARGHPPRRHCPLASDGASSARRHDASPRITRPLRRGQGQAHTPGTRLASHAGKHKGAARRLRKGVTALTQAPPLPGADSATGVDATLHAASTTL